MTSVLNYDLCKLFFDLQTDRALAAEYRRDRAAIMANYELDDAMRRALIDDDVVTLARQTNPFLLRYYFFMVGMPEDVFLAKLQPLRADRATAAVVAHG